MLSFHLLFVIFPDLLHLHFVLDCLLDLFLLNKIIPTCLNLIFSSCLSSFSIRVDLTLLPESNLDYPMAIVLVF